MTNWTETMTSWTHNTDRLKIIQTQDPLFWSQLIHIAIALEKSGCQYFDDHTYSSWWKDDGVLPELDSLTMVGIVRKYGCGLDSNRLEPVMSLDISHYNGDTPVAWVFPLNDTTVTKNPLYLDNKQQLHMTTYAHGLMIEGNNNPLLRTGYAVSQVYRDVDEITFALPADIFIAIMLEEHIQAQITVSRWWKNIYYRPGRSHYNKTMDRITQQHKRYKIDLN